MFGFRAGGVCLRRFHGRDAGRGAFGSGARSTSGSDGSHAGRRFRACIGGAS